MSAGDGSTLENRGDTAERASSRMSKMATIDVPKVSTFGAQLQSKTRGLLANGRMKQQNHGSSGTTILVADKRRGGSGKRASARGGSRPSMSATGIRVSEDGFY